MNLSILKAHTILFVISFLLPHLAYAQQPEPDVDPIIDLIDGLAQIINRLIPLTAGLAVLFFIYGLAKYILAAGSEESKSTGRRIMVGGIIALFVITAIGGILQFIGSIFDINTEAPTTLQPPRIDIQQGGSGG